MYTITAPIMGLPCACQAKRIRAKERDSTHYLPGLAFEIKNINVERKPLQNGMDGTRVVRIIELYHGKHLMGKAFPPDVRFFQNVMNMIFQECLMKIYSVTYSMYVKKINTMQKRTH